MKPGTPSRFVLSSKAFPSLASHGNILRTCDFSLREKTDDGQKSGIEKRHYGSLVMGNKDVVRVSPAATRSTHERWTVIDRALIEQKIEDAKKNLRKREIHNFHPSDQEPLHRMLNSIQPGSYIRPHRHLDPPKDEAFVLLKGSAGFVIFGAEQGLSEKEFVLLDLERGTYGIDIRAGVWHSLFTLEPDTVLYEVKPGPYMPLSDKDFAPWSPPDSSPDAADFLIQLEDEFRMYWNLIPRAWRKPNS
jgi:cupin fold WbuC family metalloprotein